MPRKPPETAKQYRVLITSSSASEPASVWATIVDGDGCVCITLAVDMIHLPNLVNANVHVGRLGKNYQVRSVEGCCLHCVECYPVESPPVMPTAESPTEGN